MTLAADTALVWWMSTDTVTRSTEGVWAAMLSDEENARAGCFVMPHDRLQYLAAHALLRAMLRHGAPGLPDTCRFLIGPHGKPELAADHDMPDFHFNLSHTLGAVACGISHGAPIGIDIENATRLSDPLDIATGTFAPEEVAMLRAAPVNERIPLFYRLWTLKEATLKAIGCGLSRPLADVVFSLAPIRLRLAGCGEMSDSQFSEWQFIGDAVSDNHVLAAAICRGAGEPAALTVNRVEPNVVSALLGIRSDMIS